MSGHPEYDRLPVSLEPHLAETLRPLVDVVPAPLSAELSPLLSVTNPTSSSTPTIPYAFLQSIARWVRTEEGTKALKAKDPPLDPLAYSMVTLLAGTRTSPDKKFPQSSHSPSSRSENAAREINDRRAIVAVLNSVLSVICTGVATWWAAQRTGWRDEWKVLLSLLTATIVAVSEIGLYIIWESRRGRGQQHETYADPGRSSPGRYPVINANSRNVGEGTPSGAIPLSDTQAQASTSIDPHQPNARVALRHRVGITS